MLHVRVIANTYVAFMCKTLLSGLYLTSKTNLFCKQENQGTQLECVQGHRANVLLSQDWTRPSSLVSVFLNALLGWRGLHAQKMVNQFRWKCVIAFPIWFFSLSYFFFLEKSMFTLFRQKEMQWCSRGFVALSTHKAFIPQLTFKPKSQGRWHLGQDTFVIVTSLLPLSLLKFNMTVHWKRA